MIPWMYTVKWFKTSSGRLPSGCCARLMAFRGFEMAKVTPR
jgi:hypothetical protein